MCVADGCTRVYDLVAVAGVYRSGLYVLGDIAIMAAGDRLNARDRKLMRKI